MLKWFHTGIAQLVEHRSPKPGVGSSNLSARAKFAFLHQKWCFFILSLFFCFILVYSGYVMDINFITIFFHFYFFLVFMFAVLLFAFMLGGFLIAILGYFRVRKLENPEILQNKIKSHRRVLNIFVGIFVVISIATVYITLDTMNFAMVGTWLGGLIAMPFAYVIIYILSFIIFAKRKDVRLRLEELEMLKRRQ